MNKNEEKILSSPEEFENNTNQTHEMKKESNLLLLYKKRIGKEESNGEPKTTDELVHSDHNKSSSSESFEKRLSSPRKNQAQDDETAIREILTELIDKNDKIIKSFNSLLMSLKRELRDRFLQKQEVQLNGKKLEESYLELLDIITESLRYNQHDDIIQEMKDRITKDYNPSNREQNEGEQDEGDSEVLRDGHYEATSKTSGYVSNMLIDGRDIEVENTISKDSGVG